MAKITIVGASNTRNTFSGKLKQLERMSNCAAEYVSATSTTAGYKALKDAQDATILVICFLLNGLTDATELCKNDAEIQMQTAILVEQYCNAIIESTTSKPDCQHYVLSPFYRASPKWLASNLSSIRTSMAEKLSTTNNRIHIIPAMDFTSTDLYDEVHLNVDAQNKLYKHIIAHILPESMEVEHTAKRGRSPSPSPLSTGTSSQTAGSPHPFIGPSSSKLSRTEDVLESNDPPVDKQNTGEHHDEAATVDEKFAAIQRNLKVHGTCLKAMIYQTANQADITDSLINTNNLNQVVVSGIPDGCFGLGLSPMIKPVVQKLVSFTKVHPGSIQTAIPQRFPIPKNSKLPDLKIIFNSPQAGVLFRQEANKLRKDKKEGWTGIYVSNVATKSTLVRIALLESIAKALQRLPANEGRIVMVNKFDTRPQLCYKTGDRITKRLFYIDAIQKYETLLTPEAIAFARKIAGKSFGIRMDPIFVVL
jgi:hypothetical protein